MQMPEPDQAVIDRRETICRDLRELVAADCVIDSVEGRRAYDADGLSAYRQLPLAVVLPTGHTEVVLVVYDPAKLALDRILTTFWQAHDPTQGFRQGNDRGTQYRSAIFVMDDDDLAIVTASAEQYQKALAKAGFGQITTEIAVNDQFYFAEDYHQQYLHKVPNGYCGLQGTGVSAG